MTKQTILFYTPFSRRSRDVETLMILFKKRGHEVISLTQTDGGVLNPFLRAQGIEAHAFVVKQSSRLYYYVQHLWYFIKFCRDKRVTLVFSHLDPANFVSSIGQYFITARVYLCRHHIDEAALYNYSSSWSYKLMNRLAKRIIVVSREALMYASKHEGIPEHKLIHINLAYDFSLYEIPSDEKIQTIRAEYKADILLLTIGRLTTFKRPHLAVEIADQLTKEGLNVKMIILGTGEKREEMETLIRSKGLTNQVFLKGHVSNVLEYLGAADFVVHPSVLESSCVVVKEAGLMEKPVLVCRDIGDFNAYIHNEQNGFLLNADSFVSEAMRIIKVNWRDKKTLTNIGASLKEDVKRIFDISNVANHYDTLLNKND